MIDLLVQIDSELVRKKIVHNNLDSAVKDLRALGDVASFIKLNTHLFEQHFSPGTLAWFGVAKMDIDIARKMGISLNWAAWKAQELLEEPDDIKAERVFLTLPQQGDVVWEQSNRPWGVDWVDEWLIKNLIYMQEQGVAQVDLDSIHKKAGFGARRVKLDIERDHFDPYFAGSSSLLRSGLPIIQPTLIKNILTPNLEELTSSKDFFKNYINDRENAEFNRGFLKQTQIEKTSRNFF